MARPRRRLVVGVLIAAGVLFCATTLWLGLKWKRTLDNVDAMRVVPLTLPTPAPDRSASEETAPAPQPLITAPPTSLAAPLAPGVNADVEPTPIPAPDGPINIL